MVWDHNSDPTESSNSTFHAPDPLDRLAAAFVDFFVVFIFAGVFLAPLQRMFRVAQVTGHYEEIPFIIAGCVLIFVCVGIIYQGLCVHFRGQTLGKRFFGLRIVDLWGNKNVKLGYALLRAVGWWFSLLAFGLPFFTVSADHRSRTIYDRLSDTRVVSYRRPRRDINNPLLYPVLRFFALFFVITIVLTLGYEMTRIFREVSNDEDRWLSDLKSMGYDTCDSVSTAQENWSDLAEGRLEVALALFGAGAASKECLEIEADYAFAHQNDESLAYLAKAFARSEDADLSDEYLAKTCSVNEKDRACLFSRLVELWTQSKWDEADKVFENLLPNSPLYVRVWAIKHFERVRNYAQELKLIHEIGPRTELGEFIGTRRVMALWNLHRKDEARFSLDATLEFASRETRISLSSWVCYRELVESCSTVHSSACDIFGRSIIDHQSLLETQPLMLTFLRREECLNPREIRYEELSQDSKNTDVQRLAYALDQWKQGNKKIAKNSLFKLALSVETERYVAAEARLRLLSWHLTNSELQKINDNWTASEQESWDWKKTGLNLAQQHFLRGDVLASQKVSERLVQADPELISARELLVQSLAKNGHRKKAWETLNSTERFSRKPASPSSYDQLVKSLRREFDR